MGRITSPLSEIPTDAVVADLLEVESGWWNGALIDRNFLPFEAQKIKSIPICTTPQEDILIWPKTRDGNYSVKSGYQLLRELEISGLASSSDFGENKKFWYDLWKMKVPNKLKTFAWRACTNFLPTLDNLVKRKIISSPICPRCKREPETVIHALWSCETLGPVWSISFEELKAVSPPFLTFVDLFRCALQNSRGADSFITHCWFLWNQRNKSRVEEAVTPLEKLSDLAQQYLHSSSPVANLLSSNLQNRISGNHRTRVL